jgi:adenylylsulfate kinase-like enzyme
MHPVPLKLPAVIWITGLPGSGKTTLGVNIKQSLITSNLSVIHLDGDEIRQALSLKNSLEVRERLEIAKIYQNLVMMLIKQTDIVIITTVSLFEEILEKNNNLFENYFEIFLSVNQELLNNGPRKFIYNSKQNVYTKDIEPYLPKKSNLILTADQPYEREKWLEIAILKVGQFLGIN